MRLALAGISHRRTPVELRERVALDRPRAHDVARSLAADGAEAVCLSTCNRTELYVAHPEIDVAETLAERPLRDDALAETIYRFRDEDVALHLFRVAAGLDSMVPGEGEILGQVRAAFDAGAPGPVLDRLFRQAVYTGRKVRLQTAIAESPASVSAAAAALAQQVFGDLRGRRVLLVGAGKASDLAARSLAARGAHVAHVANRTLERARDVAGRVGAEALPLDELRPELARADVVVSSTAAPGVVIRHEDVEAVLDARSGRPLFLIDLAVPRDVDPAVHELPDCYVYDIDDLQAVVDASLAGRRREAERAEAIVVAEGETFAAWRASLDVVPAIASLRERADEIRRSELAKLERRLGGLPEAERRAVEAATAQIVNKLLHLPTVRMKEAAVTADGVIYAHAVRHLFGLGEEER